MGRNMILALGLRGAGAVAWFGYFWVLSQLLSPAALGTTLYALALASVGAMLTSAGWTQLVLRDGARAVAKNQRSAFSTLIRRATKGTIIRVSLVAMAVAALAGFEALPPMIPSIPIAVLTCTITAALALLHIRCAAQRANHRLIRALAGQGALLAGIPLGLTIFAALFMPISPIVVLFLHLSSLILILIWMGCGLPKLNTGAPSNTTLRALRTLSLGQAGQVLLSHMDILVLGWLISPAEAGIYLIVRRLAGLLGLVFDALRSAAAPRLAVAFDDGTAAFLAKGVNYIFLLTGLGCGGLLWLCAPFILPLFGAANASGAFHGLLIGALAPALFGATGLLMVMGNLEFERVKLMLVLLPISMAVLLYSGDFGITGLAIGAGSVQVLGGAGGAMVLACHHKIWPGLIALIKSMLKCFARETTRNLVK